MPFKCVNPIKTSTHYNINFVTDIERKHLNRTDVQIWNFLRRTHNFDNEPQRPLIQILMNEVSVVEGIKHMSQKFELYKLYMISRVI